MVLTAWDVDTTVVLTGTCRTAGAPVPMLMGVLVAPEATATVLDTAAFMLGRDTADVWTVPDPPATEDPGLAWAATVMVWPALGGITPRPCTMRMVAAGFASDEATVLFPFCSATLTPSAGIKRNADPEPSAGLRSGATLTTVVPAGVEAGALAELALAGLSVAWTGLEVTCKVAEMPLPAVPPPVPKRSWVSLTVVTWDLANVAIMSGVIRRTVWPLASVVMEEGGRRSTSLPWMRKFVAVSGMLLPVWGFTPSCPVIATWWGETALTEGSPALHWLRRSYANLHSCFMYFSNSSFFKMIHIHKRE